MIDWLLSLLSREYTRPLARLLRLPKVPPRSDPQRVVWRLQQLLQAVCLPRRRSRHSSVGATRRSMAERDRVPADAAVMKRVAKRPIREAGPVIRDRLL